MPRNGSNGTFTRVYDFTDDAAANIKIRADRMDAELDGMATALTASIAKDGQTTATADLPMGTKKHTAVGNATARDQYCTVASLQDGSHNWVAAGGTADAITATYAPALTALVDGQLCFVRASAANATTTPTFAPNGLTAHTITKQGGTALVAGDISAAGHELILRYKLASTIWELLNPAAAATTLSTRQKLTSGSAATYTTPAGARQLRIRFAGAGGGSGGGGASSGSTAGGTGGTTTFNSINAVGGGRGGGAHGRPLVAAPRSRTPRQARKREISAMFTYTQARPRLSHNGKTVMGAPLYSGYQGGLNNPALDYLPNVGPIPAGQWKIIRWDEHHAEKGPCVAVLEPVGHDAHGRSHFLIHGDGPGEPYTASRGCIVASHAIRQYMRDSGDMDLLVIPGTPQGAIA